MKFIFGFIIFILILSTIGFLLNPYKPAGESAKEEIVMLDSESPDAASLKLDDKNLIRSFTAFNLLYKIIGNNKIEPGGYNFSSNMSSIKIIRELNEGPDLLSITFPEGLRKEQIGERLAKRLKWNNEKLSEWNNVYAKKNTEFKEGVYFPDTYLIPVNETPTQVAHRMIANFNDKFKPYLEEATEKNIKWTTVIKIASLIQREAGGNGDMKIISGVIWNRLEDGHKLQLDAEIQYAKGKAIGSETWWSPVSGKDIREIDSPYNSYKYAGLPPTPISNPGLSAIEAALNPEETDCYFYLHDRSRQIHCAVTYEEHLENIEKYLN